MNNPKHLKYLRLFENFFKMNELMGHLREIARKLILDMPNADGEITIDNFKIELFFKSEVEDKINQLLAIIRQDGERVGSILLDFGNSEFPGSIVVQYSIGNANEGVSLYSRKEKFEGDLLNSEKFRKRIEMRNKLSAMLTK